MKMILLAAAAGSAWGRALDSRIEASYLGSVVVLEVCGFKHEVVSCLLSFSVSPLVSIDYTSTRMPRAPSQEHRSYTSA